ncbi:ATP binding, partial [Nowakowskiella sp. JEL0078]
DRQWFGIFSYDLCGEIDTAHPLDDIQLYEFGKSMNYSLRGSLILGLLNESPVTTLLQNLSRTASQTLEPSDKDFLGPLPTHHSYSTDKKDRFKLHNPLQKSNSFSGRSRKINTSQTSILKHKAKNQSSEKSKTVIENPTATKSNMNNLAERKSKQGKIQKFFGENPPIINNAGSYNSVKIVPDIWDSYLASGFTTSTEDRKEFALSPAAALGERPPSEIIADCLVEFFPNLFSNSTENKALSVESSAAHNVQNEPDLQQKINEQDTKSIQNFIHRTLKTTIESKKELRKSAAARERTIRSRDGRSSATFSVTSLIEESQEDPHNSQSAFLKPSYGEENLSTKIQSISKKRLGTLDPDENIQWCERLASISKDSLFGIGFDPGNATNTRNIGKRHTHFGVDFRSSTGSKQLSYGSLPRIRKQSINFGRAKENFELLERRSFATPNKFSYNFDEVKIDNTKSIENIFDPEKLSAYFPTTYSAESSQSGNSSLNQSPISTSTDQEIESQVCVSEEFYELEDYDDILEEEEEKDTFNEMQVETDLEYPSSLEKQTKIKWDRGKMIGKGSFGRVFYGLNLTTSEIMAVKQVELASGKGSESLKKRMNDALYREISLLSELRHSAIVRYLGIKS